MREYIDLVNRLYQPESKTLAESIQAASDFEVDLILESMDESELMELNGRLMEFDDPSPQDMSLLTKIGAKIFGQQWAANKQSSMQAMDDYNKFMTDWTRYSKRFNLQLTVDNLKDFLKNEYEMGDQSFKIATDKVKPQIDRKAKTITNMEQLVPAIAYAYFYGMGDAIEKRAEEKHIDIDNLGYDKIPNNGSDFEAAPGAANAMAGGEQNGQPAKPNAPVASDAEISAAQISKKMGNILSSLHVSTDDRQQAMVDSKRGFQQSFSKNSRTLAAIGFAYLKAIGAS